MTTFMRSEQEPRMLRRDTKVSVKVKYKKSDDCCGDLTSG